MSNADEKHAAGIESNCEKAIEDHKGNFTQKKKNKREIQWLPKKTHPQSNAFHRRLFLLIVTSIRLSGHTKLVID